MRDSKIRSKNRFRDRMLAILASVITRRPGWIMALAILMAVSGGVLSLSKLQLDADTNSLIGDERPFMQTYRAYLDRFGDLEAIFVVVDAGPEVNATQAERAVDSLTSALQEIPSLETVRAKITPEEQWKLSSHAMPQVRLDDLIRNTEAIESVLENQDLIQLLAAANRMLQRTMTPDATDEAERIRTFGNAFFILESLTKQNEPDGMANELGTEYLTSSTGRMYFIEIMPEKNFNSLSIIDEPLRRIRDTIAATSPDFPQLEIGVTGKPVLQADELATSARDMTTGTVCALIAISILFMAFFREYKRPLLAVLAFLIAFGWTYGAATLIVGRLNLLSMVFMLVLVGAGIDYGIHVIARWRESRRANGTRESVRRIMMTAVMGNITGAATSAGVFFLALATDFQGLRELGIIAGIGLVFCGVSMAVVLPALLRLTEGEGNATLNDTERNTAPLGKGRSQRLDRMVIALALGSVIPAFLITMNGLHFESNLLELQSENLESVRWEKALFQDDSSGSWFGAVVVDELEAIPAVVELAEKHAEVGPIKSALDLVAVPTSVRNESRKALAALGNDPKAPFIPAAENKGTTLREELTRASTRLRMTLDLGGTAITEDQRIRINELRKNLAMLAAADGVMVRARLEKTRTQSRQHLEWMIEGADLPVRSVLPEAVRSRFSAKDGSYAVLIQPRQNIWDPGAMQDFVTALRTISPDATGVPITQYESIREMHHAFLVMAWGSIIVVGLGVWLDFRSLPRTLACLLTLALAISWTLSGMAAFGLSINLANFFAIPILIGLGADSCIHVVHRWEMVRTGEEHGFGETLKAVTMTACTTGIGFGTLIFAQHQGLQSLGWVMALGSASVLMASTVVLPAGLQLSKGKNTN